MDEIENKKDNSKKRERAKADSQQSHLVSARSRLNIKRYKRKGKGGKEEGEEYKKKRRKNE